MSANTAFLQREEKLTDTAKPEFLHLGYLDSLRAVAALYVVLHHASLCIDVSLNSISLESILYRLVNKGHYAVNLFIVLSGFCLMLPVARNNGIMKGSVIGFFKKRAKRILPTYYLSIALCVLLINTVIGQQTGTIWDSSVPISNWDIVARLLLIQDLLIDAHSKINYVFWSISVEWRIYFLFPILVILYKRWGAFTTTMLVVAISIALWYALQPIGINLSKTGFNPHYVGLFILGMLASKISFSTQDQYTKIRKYGHWNYVFLATLALTFIAILSHLHWLFLDIMIGLNGAVMLIALAFGKLRHLYIFLSWKPLIFIGTFGYSLYLVHAPLLQILFQYIVVPLDMSPLMGILFLFIIGTPIIVVTSYLFYIVAERPFIRKRGLDVKPVAGIVAAP